MFGAKFFFNSGLAETIIDMYVSININALLNMHKECVTTVVTLAKAKMWPWFHNNGILFTI